VFAVLQQAVTPVSGLMFARFIRGLRRPVSTSAERSIGVVGGGTAALASYCPYREKKKEDAIMPSVLYIKGVQRGNTMAANNQAQKRVAIIENRLRMQSFKLQG